MTRINILSRKVEDVAISLKNCSDIVNEGKNPSIVACSLVSLAFKAINKGLLDNLYKGLNEALEYSKIMIKKGNLSKYFIHFKELDVMGHDNNPIEKKKMIELIDKEFFGFLRKLDDVEFIVTGDHACPCELRGHASDAVPLLHYKKGVKRDTMKRFNESEAEDGYYKQILGKDVLRKLGFENNNIEV